MRRRAVIAAAIQIKDRNRTALSMVTMLRRSPRIAAVAPELLILDDLIGVEQGTGFEMCRQMHRPQAALQLGNCGRRSGEPVRRNFTFGKELVEGLFLRDHLAASGFAAALIRSKIVRTLRCCVSVSPSGAASANTCAGPG